MPTLGQIESALADGELWAKMNSGRYWRLRRNGATQRWKTRPADYRIPVKAGLRVFSSITQGDFVAFVGEPADDGWRAAPFVISSTEPKGR